MASMIGWAGGGRGRRAGGENKKKEESVFLDSLQNENTTPPLARPGEMASPPDPCLAPGHVGRGMPSPAFRAAATATIDFIVDYYERRLEGRGDAPPLPVRSRVAPGYLRPLLRDEPPEEGEAFDAVLADLEAHILPGVTHWQSPSFFAYYPANASYPGILGEEKGERERERKGGRASNRGGGMHCV